MADETLFALLPKEQRLERIVGLSKLAADPRFSNLASADVNAFAKIDSGAIETIVQLKPDLVVCSPYNRVELLHLLTQLKIPQLLLSDAKTLAGIRENIFRIAEKIGAQNRAEKLWSEVDQRLHRLQTKRPRQLPTVVNYSPEYAVFGSDTLFAHVVEQAGAINLPSTLKLKGWQPVNSELIAGLKPDFVIAEGEATDKAVVQKKLLSLQGWRDVPAVKAGKIILVPPRLLFATSHHVADAIEIINQAL